MFKFLRLTNNFLFTSFIAKEFYLLRNNMRLLHENETKPLAHIFSIEKNIYKKLITDMMTGSFVIKVRIILLPFAVSKSIYADCTGICIYRHCLWVCKNMVTVFYGVLQVIIVLWDELHILTKNFAVYRTKYIVQLSSNENELRNIGVCEMLFNTR